MKTITIDEETWKNLITIKYSMNFLSLDETINRLILNYKSLEQKEVVEDSNGKEI